MGECICKIEKAANGFEVELYDPEVAKKNASSKGQWRDPMVAHVFNTVEEVITFLTKNLADAGKFSDEYSSSFNTLVGAEEDDD